MSASSLPIHLLEAHVLPMLDTTRCKLSLALALGKSEFTRFCKANNTSIRVEKRNAQTNFLIGDSYVSNDAKGVWLTVTSSCPKMTVFKVPRSVEINGCDGYGFRYKRKYNVWSRFNIQGPACFDKVSLGPREFIRVDK